MGQDPPRFIRCGIRVFGRLEVQPGVLVVLFQQTLMFKAAADTLADHLNQALQLTLIRRPDTMKSG
jgi:hypothetical protein